MKTRYTPPTRRREDLCAMRWTVLEQQTLPPRWRTRVMPPSKLEELKSKIEKLSPQARLLLASQLIGKGDFDAVEVGITIAEGVVHEWRAAKLVAGAK
jgi:hypothetical protein